MQKHGAAARRWGKHKRTTVFCAGSISIKHYYSSSQKLIFNCKVSGILSNMLVSAGFTVLALNYTKSEDLPTPYKH